MAIAVTCLAASAMLAETAYANGRFPATSSITFRKGSPNDVIVGTTYGAIISRDRGASWRWICELSMNYTGPIDPVFLWSRRGDIFASTTVDLMISRDNGCSWTPYAGFADRGPADVIEHPTIDDTIFLVTSGADAEGTSNGLYKSTDAGRSFTPTSLQRSEVFMGAVRFAPSNNRRMYVTGWRALPPKAAWVFRSDDGGETWSDLQQEDLPAPAYFFTLGVDPSNADVVYTLASSITATGEVLRRSEDGGRTGTVVLTEREGIRGLAISPDGQTVWVASLNRIYRSTDGGRTFGAVFDGGVTLERPTRNACVAHDRNELWACGWQFDDGFALAKSTNSGDTWERVYNLADLGGPASCPAGTATNDQCEPAWPALAQLLGVQRDGGTTPPRDAGPPPTDGGTAPNPPPKNCGCSAVEGGTTALAVMLALILMARRSRRARRLESDRR